MDFDVAQCKLCCGGMLSELNISLYFNELLKGKSPIQSGALSFHFCKKI